MARSRTSAVSAVGMLAALVLTLVALSVPLGRQCGDNTAQLPLLAHLSTGTRGAAKELQGRKVAVAEGTIAPKKAFVATALATATPLPAGWRDVSDAAAGRALLVPEMRAAGLPVQVFEAEGADGGMPATCIPALEGGKFSAAAAEAFNNGTGTMPGINIAPDILAGVHPSLRVKWTLQLARGRTGVNFTERTRMENATLGQYCGARQHFRGDHIPLGGCPGDKGDVTTPPNLYPWCLPPSEPQHVVVVECGFTSSFTHHPNVEMDTLCPFGLLSADKERWRVNPNHTVQEFDDLGVPGANEYPDAPGHFPNEILPSLLILDRLLPPHVPLLWPAKGIVEAMTPHLLAEGVLSGRQLVRVNGPSTHRAKRMYLFQPERQWHQGPNIAFLPQRLTATAFAAVTSRRLAAAGKPEPDAALRAHTIVVLQRPGVRKIANSTTMLERLAAVLGPAFTIDTFIPGNSYGNPMWTTAERVYHAGFLIGPHGANMHNAIYLAPGSPSWVLEVGYIDAGMALPTDWYCLARNLGFTYYLSIATGNYGSALQVDLDDITAIAARYRAHVEAAHPGWTRPIPTAAPTTRPSQR